MTFCLIIIFYYITFSNEPTLLLSVCYLKPCLCFCFLTCKFIPVGKILSNPLHVNRLTVHQKQIGLTTGKFYYPSYYAPNFEKVDGAQLLLAYTFVLPSITLFYASCNFGTVHAKVWKFYIWIPHGKIADPYFFSCLSYGPFWSYAPLKMRWKSC